MTIKGRYEEDARNKLWPADLLLAVKREKKACVWFWDILLCITYQRFLLKSQVNLKRTRVPENSLSATRAGYIYKTGWNFLSLLPFFFLFLRKGQY